LPIVLSVLGKEYISIMSNIIKAVMRRAKEHSYQNSGRNIENSRDLLLT